MLRNMHGMRIDHHIRKSTQKFEKKQMQRLLKQWLELETKRPAFQVIETEKKYLLHLPEEGITTDLPAYVRRPN